MSGSHFDQYGNLNDWWTPHVRDNFHIRSACMQRQYSNFSVPGIEEKVKFNLLELIPTNILQGIKFPQLLFFEFFFQ